MKIKQALALFVFLLSIGARAEDIDSNPTMDGIYEMTIQIGTQTYLNTFVLTGKTRPITAYSFGGGITGSIGIPGQFSSPFEGNGRCSLWNDYCQFQFSVTTHEGDQSSKVIYEARFADPEYLKFLNGKEQRVVLTGTAFRENGEFLGAFKAIRNR